MSWFRGFPDYRITIEDLVAEDDKVAETLDVLRRAYWRVPGTRKPVMMRAVTIYCFSAGQVTDISWNYDAAGLMQQLVTT